MSAPSPTRPKRIYPSAPPLSVLSHDILPKIIIHLPRRDLAVACQASRLFHEVAGKALYSSREGVVAGNEMCYRWIPCHTGHGGQAGGNYDTRYRPSLFTGTLDITGKINPPPYIPPDRLPSTAQLQLLKSVRHLIYISNHCPYPFDSLDSTNLFPSLDTITIQPNFGYRVAEWNLPFLSGLKPRHIRLARIPYLGYNDGDFQQLPRVTLGGRKAVEKITVHIADVEVEGGLGNLLDVEWPVKVSQIDFVFLAPTGPDYEQNKRDKPLASFRSGRPPVIPDVSAGARSVAHIVASAAGTGASIRVVGLTEGQNVFRRVLKDEYCEALKSAGMGEGEANRRAKGLVYATLAAYRAEADYTPF